MKVQDKAGIGITGKQVQLSAVELIILADLRRDLGKLHKWETDATIDTDEPMPEEDWQQLMVSVKKAEILLEKICGETVGLQEANEDLFGDLSTIYEVEKVQEIIDNEMQIHENKHERTNYSQRDPSTNV